MRGPIAAATARDGGARETLSVVVPCYNEAEAIRATHERLTTALERLDVGAFEVVYVDDGSADATLEILREVQRGDARVRVVSFSRNFGHQVAVTAGIEHAIGDAVVLIDADLQDPPELIAEFVARWREGYDVAYGVRVERDGETRFKRWTASQFYRLINRMSDVPIPLDTGDFRLISRAVAEVFLAMPEHDRFVRGMVAWAGFRQAAVPYRRAARVAGESKYPLFKMLRFALDGITSFSGVPLRLATWIGFTASALSLAGIVYALAVRLFTKAWVPGWAGVFIAILFMGGAQLLSLGLIGEYVAHIYGESKRRPLYVVQERLGFAGARPAASRVGTAARGTAGELPRQQGG